MSDQGRGDLPLRGRAALVTGVSRRAGIGFAIARRLAGAGASIFAQHHVPHDADRDWAADPDGIDPVLDELRDAFADPRASLADAGVDLAAPGSAERLFDQALGALGHVDILVCNHASSGPDAPLARLTEEMLDSHWAVNTRSSLLLVRALAKAHDGRPGGRVVLMTSGQGLGPMPGEIAYAASKGALAEVTLTLSGRGPATRRRWGEPDDAARLIEWLVSDDGRWMTGQVLNSEGGFRRWGRLVGGGDPGGQSA